MMISYAQNAEDVLLNRLFPPGYRGFYLDIGANHPTHHSVTRHFYDLGWYGVNIEPSPVVFPMLVEARPRDINLNVGVSDRQAQLAFFQATTSLGMSTFSRDFAAGLQRDGYPVAETSVSVLTLAMVCDQFANRTIDFLKIDVESHETEVIAGGDWRKHRPRAVVVEATGGFDWEQMLLKADYMFAVFDGLNRYYLRKEDRDLLPKLASPSNFLDQFVNYEHARDLVDARWERDHLRDQLTFERARVAELEQLWSSERDELEALRIRLESVGNLGPKTIALAKHVRRTSQRFPGVAGAIKSFWKAG